MDPSGSSVRGILQTRILEWVAMPSSRESSLGRRIVKKSLLFFFYTLIIYFIKCYNQHYKSVLEHFHLFNKIFTWHQWSGPTGQGSTCWVEAFVSIQIHSHRGFPAGASGKEPACQCRRRRFNPFPAGKILWRRAWQPTPVFLAWRIPWTEELGGLQTTGSQRSEHNWATKTFMFLLHVLYEGLWQTSACICEGFEILWCSFEGTFAT